MSGLELFQLGPDSYAGLDGLEMFATTVGVDCVAIDGAGVDE